MARTYLPLLVIDEIMLPGGDTEVSLEPGEAELFAARLGDETPLLIACRDPRRPRPTSLESKASGSPGELLDAGLLATGALAGDELEPRLTIFDSRRVRLGEVRSSRDGWEATCEPWPLSGTAGVDPDSVQALVHRFFRALLVTMPEQDGGQGVEGAVGQLARAERPAQRLFLLADYLFERDDVRRQILLAEQAAEVKDTAEDALELIEQGLETGPRAVREALVTYLGRAGSEQVERLGRMATVLTALAPLVDEEGELAEQTAETVELLGALERSMDRLALRLTKRRGRRR